MRDEGGKVGVVGAREKTRCRYFAAGQPDAGVRVGLGDATTNLEGRDRPRHGLAARKRNSGGGATPSSGRRASGLLGWAAARDARAVTVA